LTARIVPAEGAVLQRIVATTPLVNGGLSRAALARHEAAQAKTAWALGHQRRFALMQGDQVLASAKRYELTGRLDRELVTICGIAEVLVSQPDADGRRDGEALVADLVQEAARNGATLALLFRAADGWSPWPDGFVVVPTTDLELTVTESARRGAPMTLVRGGEDRDLDAIAAMGHTRGDGFRFRIERSAGFVKHAITRKRLLAGLCAAGARQIEFVIAEEGITAAAYVVISVAGGTWTIEECGDRDATGARVGALLQALIARGPSSSRPVIRGWLPPGFLPPQVTIASSSPAPPVLLARALSPRVQDVHLAARDVMYWRSDLF
jgi:hypothetical protein